MDRGRLSDLLVQKAGLWGESCKTSKIAGLARIENSIPAWSSLFPIHHQFRKQVKFNMKRKERER
jgi:hypothetical protein